MRELPLHIRDISFPLIKRKSYFIIVIEHIDSESERKRTEQSFLVPKQEIVDNGYDLSINKYKEIEYIPVEYPPTSEILANIKALNEQIMADTAELERLLNE